MKRQIIAVAIGSLFALPAFADGEIGFDFRTVAKAESSKSVAQVRAELVAAQRAGGYAVDGEIGSVWSASAMGDGKSRAQVMAELTAAQDDDTFVDGEIGGRIPRS
jgi:uncharacterized BrkB/YihY/UPF0761 family membrane protein